MKFLASYRPRSINDPTFWLRIALVFVAAFSFTRGWRYGIGREPIPMALEFVTSGFSISVYGFLWFFASLCALVSIPKVWPAGSFPTIVLSLVFAFGFTLSWLSALDLPPGSPGRADYTSASNYWTPVGLLVCGYFLSRKALSQGCSSPRQE